jgi:hypothetical protein
MKTTLLIGALTLAGAWFAAAGQPLPADTIPAAEGPIQVFPINHATFVLQHGGRMIYVDPVGGEKAFAGFAKPGLILVTHIHGDHFSTETLTAVAGPDTKLVAPPSVAEQLPANLKERTTVLKNGESGEVTGVRIQAIPAYNTTPERLKFHPKGRDNGYWSASGAKGFTSAANTEDIPENARLEGHRRGVCVHEPALHHDGPSRRPAPCANSSRPWCTLTTRAERTSNRSRRKWARTAARKCAC